MNHFVRVACALAVLVSLGCGGSSSSKPPVPPPSIASFTASTNSPILAGANATLTPVFSGGTGVVQPGAIAAVSGAPITVSPNLTTLYTLQVTNSANATASATATVTVDGASAIVGPEGGILRMAGGATVEIPFGALDKPTSLSFAASTVAAPAGVATAGPVYRFDPAATVFVRPVKVTLPVPAGASAGAIYWSRPGVAGFGSFDSRGGVASGQSISIETPHFGLAAIGPATATRAVVGVGHTTWISGTTRDSEPEDFAAVGVEALVQDTGGNLVPIAGIPGTGAASGTFLIPGVPDGEYILHSGIRYVATASGSPDLGTQLGGRPAHLRTPITTAAGMILTVSGLEPWQATDQLEFYGTEENDWDFDSERFAALHPGDTGVSFFLDLSQFDGGPASAIRSQGDHSFLAQLSGRQTSSGVPYVALSRIATLPPFDLASPDQVPVSASMVELPVKTLNVDYRGTQWEAALADGNPARAPLCAFTGCKGFFGVVGQAGSTQDGFYAANADVMLLEDPAGDGALGPLTYGSLPSDATTGSWGLLFEARRFATVFPTLPPGTTYAPSLQGGISFGVRWTTTPDVVQTLPLAPPVSMPISITVAGKPFFTDAQGIGLTPSIAWTAPRTGQPTIYGLTIFHLAVNAANQLFQTQIATIVTPASSLTLPAGIVAPGGAYVFSLTAFAATAPGAAALLKGAPFRAGPDIAAASTVSGTFAP